MPWFLYLDAPHGIHALEGLLKCKKIIGIYELFSDKDGREPLYVGKSIDLCGRLFSHWKRRHGDFKRVHLEVYNDVIQKHSLQHDAINLMLSFIEGWRIEELNPSDNLHHPYCGWDWFNKHSRTLSQKDQFFLTKLLWHAEYPEDLFTARPVCELEGKKGKAPFCRLPFKGSFFGQRYYGRSISTKSTFTHQHALI